MRCIVCVFVLSWWVGACADEVEDAEREAPPPATTSQPVGVAPQPAAEFEPASRPVPQATLSIERIDVKRAENGAGAIVEAVDARALDLRADSWPGRALDPVLSIGQLSFHRYSHPDKHTLRYVVSDAALLPRGAEVTLQYGDDASTKIVVGVVP